MKFLLFALLLFLVSFLYFASDYRVIAKPIIVPHCFDRSLGMFLPCSDVDVYYYA